MLTIQNFKLRQNKMKNYKLDEIKLFLVILNFK